jgi:predicted RecB family endonuclease
LSKLVTALPDLNVLPAKELRVLILAQHEQLVSAEGKLTTTQEQLLSREREIEHLKLLLVKLHRIQFGRKSEKLARQIEQLELRLEGAGIQPQRERVHAARTGFGASWFDCRCSEAGAPRSPRSSPAANAPARAEKNHVPAMPG